MLKNDHRKAGKLGADHFAAHFSPTDLGILELSKLNTYGNIYLLLFCICLITTYQVLATQVNTPCKDTVHFPSLSSHRPQGRHPHHPPQQQRMDLRLFQTFKAADN
jgi:hypothetical protein